MKQTTYHCVVPGWRICAAVCAVPLHPSVPSTVWCLTKHGNSFTLCEVFSFEWVVSLTLLCEQWEVDYHLKWCTCLYARVTKRCSKWWKLTMWLLFGHNVIWYLSDFRLNLYFLLHFVMMLCVCVCVEHWACCNFIVLVVCVCVCVCTVKKILLSGKKLFIYVFIVMVYIFYLLNAVTVVYDGG